MKRSTVLIAASTFIAVTALMFLAGAFAAASFDITKWSPDGRAMGAFFWLMMAPLISVVAAMFLSEGAI